jgi:hypothetical protein
MGPGVRRDDRGDIILQIQLSPGQLANALSITSPIGCQAVPSMLPNLRR